MGRGGRELPSGKCGIAAGGRGREIRVRGWKVLGADMRRAMSDVPYGTRKKQGERRCVYRVSARISPEKFLTEEVSENAQF